MAQRLQFSNIQNSRIPVACNVCPDDERLKLWFNEAEELMLNQGRWWGSLWEFNACVTSGCLTMPMEVDTVEQMNVNGSAINMANGWWGFTRLVGDAAAWWSTWGVAGGSGCGWPASACRSSNWCGKVPTAREKETTVCTFATTRAGDVIRVYPGNPVDVGKTITFQGNDSNGIWVKTAVGGSLIDGERVTLALPYVDTVTRWAAGQPVAVYRDATQQLVRVYSHDTVANSDLAIAVYQPQETQPTYRQLWVPGLENVRGCGDGSLKTVTCLVSLRHVDVVSASDWLVLQNIPAYKAAMAAVKAREEGDYAKFSFEFYGTQAAGRNARGVERVVNRAGAIPLLQAELRKKTSDRVTTTVYTDPTMTFQRHMAGFR